MSLLKCEECGGMVSSKAAACPHCGCPVAEMSQRHTCIINQKEYDLSEILDLALGYEPGNDNRILGRKGIMRITGLGLVDACALWENIVAIRAIPDRYPNKVREVNCVEPKCPTCGSTSLTKLNAGHRAIDGLFFGHLSVEGRAQFRCNKCGYMW